MSGVGAGTEDSDQDTSMDSSPWQQEDLDHVAKPVQDDTSRYEHAPLFSKVSITSVHARLA